jgi:tRNA (mo5U34)-methyltransferase
MMGKMGADARKRANELTWWHSIRLADDFTTSGKENIDAENWRVSLLPRNLKGKTVLDIGCNDGLYSFECEKKGASKVIAIDNLTDPRVEKTFQFAKETLNSKVEWRKMSVYDVENLNEKFDLVLFMGVYYHLEDPIRALRTIRTAASDLVIIEGHFNKGSDPVMWLYEPFELNPEDPTNVWGPTLPCLERMCKHAGFHQFKLMSTWNRSRVIAYLQ